MECNCNVNSFGKCRNYGKPGCLCALRDQKALNEASAESTDCEPE